MLAVGDDDGLQAHHSLSKERNKSVARLLRRTKRTCENKYLKRVAGYLSNVRVGEVQVDDVDEILGLESALGTTGAGHDTRYLVERLVGHGLALIARRCC